MWEFIDKAIYINLDSRPDRLVIMNKFFEDSKIPLEKVHRFSAIKRNKGQLGCVESHMQVLKLAKKEGWKNVLVLEDDLKILNFEEGYKKLEEIVNFPKWDVVMLTGWYWEYSFPRIFRASNTGAYLVNGDYIDKLLENRETSVLKMSSQRNVGFSKSTTKYNADMYWNELQKIDVWYGINPCLAYQVDGFSDINKKIIESSKIVGIANSETKKQVYC
jgi:glycosyl transferase family 25